MLPAFTLQRAATLADALDAISGGAVPYAGGTELLLAMRAGLLRPALLVDLKRIAELAAIEVTGDVVRIGATATHADIARNAAVAEHAALLAHVERFVGNPRVRAQGTIGGNVCFAEPKSDVTTALVALDATLTLASPAQTRSLPVGEFLEGAYSTTRQEDELLVSIDVPATARPSAYLKFQTMERPTVGVAVTAEPDGSACRVVVGSVDECPRVFAADDLDGFDPQAMAADLDPIADLTGSEGYKRHVATVFIRRAIRHLKGSLDGHS